MATLFDTLAFTRRLTDSGIDRQQSEAIAGAVHDAVRGSVATQHDLDLARTQIGSHIEGTKQGLQLEIQQTRQELQLEIQQTKQELQLEIQQTRQELQLEIQRTKQELRLEIHSVRADVLVLRWMTGAIVAGVLALVVKAFF